MNAIPSSIWYMYDCTSPHLISVFEQLSALPCIQVIIAKTAANTLRKQRPQQMSAASMSNSLHILGMGSCKASGWIMLMDIQLNLAEWQLGRQMLSKSVQHMTGQHR